MAGFCEHGNELLRFHEGLEIFFTRSVRLLPSQEGHLLPLQLMEDVNVEEDRIQTYNVSNGF